MMLESANKKIMLQPAELQLIVLFGDLVCVPKKFF